jgi:hypothetical protein
LQRTGLNVGKRWPAERAQSILAALRMAGRGLAIRAAAWSIQYAVKTQLLGNRADRRASAGWIRLPIYIF